MKYLALLSLLLLAGCGLTGAWWVDAQYDPQFDIPATGATTPQGVCWWVDARVTWLDDAIHDEIEYWQSPDQTYEWGRGDCEDYVLLVMYLIHRDLGGWPEMIIGDYDDGKTIGPHAWVTYGGRWYEPQGGQDVTDSLYYTRDHTVVYGEALWRSMHWHYSVR